MNFIAHRGLRNNKIKENTIEAFLNAINSSFFAGFEFDIRETCDKKYIVNHNAFLKNNLIKTTKYKDLNALPLIKVLKLKTNKIFLVEVKDFNIAYKKFVKIINKFSYQNIYIMSFHENIIKNLKKYHIKAKLGVLNYVLNSKSSYDYDFICLLDSFATKEIVSTYQRKNITVMIYGVINDEKRRHKNVFYIIDKIPKK